MGVDNNATMLVMVDLMVDVAVVVARCHQDRHHPLRVDLVIPSSSSNF